MSKDKDKADSPPKRVEKKEVPAQNRRGNDTLLWLAVNAENVLLRSLKFSRRL